MNTDLKAKFTGALLGSAIGDALGAPVEGYSMEKVKAVYGEGEMKAGRYTDDTEMMIGVAESLIANRGFNGADMALRFILNYDATRRYGPGSKEVLGRIHAGESWREASKQIFGGEGSYGNGAAMRIAPVGIFYCDNAELLREIAYKSSHITHSHVLGKEGAALQAYSIALALHGHKADMPSRLKGFVKDVSFKNIALAKEYCTIGTTNDVYKEKLSKLEQLLGKQTAKAELITELGTGEAAFDSVPTAIYSFIHANSFKDAVMYAIRLGGDTDTIGAMTGAISGAYYGEAAIPGAWLDNLEEGAKGRSYIKRLGAELYRIKIQTS